MIASILVSFVCSDSISRNILFFNFDVYSSADGSVFLKENWSTADFVTNYLRLVMFPLMYIIAKFVYQEPYKKPSKLDFVTNIESATLVFFFLLL